MKNNKKIITLLTFILFIVSFISLFVIDYSIGKNRSIVDIIFLISSVIYLFIFIYISFYMSDNEITQSPN